MRLVRAVAWETAYLTRVRKFPDARTHLGVQRQRLNPADLAEMRRRFDAIQRMWHERKGGG